MSKDTPTIMVRFEKGKITPDQPHDAELLDTYKGGSLFELKDRTNRNNEHNSYYWLVLNRVVEATGEWANAEMLHRQLLIKCGFYETVATLDGGVRLEASSTSFTSMKQKDFHDYTDQAFLKIAEIGIDLDALMGEPA